MLKISDITKFTLQDYPSKTACIIWFAGCNLRCQYCHNTEFLEQDDGFLKEEDVLKFLNKRIGLFDGVVLSGGECSLGNNEVIEFIKKIKKLGFLVKIDTNGLNYNFVEYLINNKLIDFIALDFKAMDLKFDFVTQTKNQFNTFLKTLKFVLNSDIDREIRTTIHIDLMDENDINQIIDLLDDLKYDKTYFIQNFRNDNKETLNKLPEQSRLLDFSKIKQPKHFKIAYRNFR